MVGEVGPDLAIDVLDKGYVRLVDYMGSDVSVVNAARVSYNKRTEKIRESDVKLIRYLKEHGHSSPFRHASCTFEVKAPLMVARQWWKYVVGSDHTMEGWNEVSRRYVNDMPEYYVPDVWFKQSGKNKQGGEGVTPLTPELNLMLEKIQSQATHNYSWAIASGISAEQARLFLPAYGLYTTWYWTASLQSVLHFLAQRLEHDAQYEITQYAIAVRELIQPLFPYCVKEFLDYPA